MKYILVVCGVITLTGASTCAVKRTPAFDQLVQHIAHNKPQEKPVTNISSATLQQYPQTISKLNRASCIYFLIRLATYEQAAEYCKRHCTNNSLTGWGKKYFSQFWVYKISSVAIETLILKTIIKSAIYISMHDAFDFIADAAKRLFTIILSTLIVQ